MKIPRFSIYAILVGVLTASLLTASAAPSVGVYHGILPTGWFEVTNPGETGGLLMYVTNVEATGTTDIDIKSSRLINWTSVGGGAVKAYVVTMSDFISGSWTYLAFDPKASQSDIDHYNTEGWKNYITEFTFKNDHALYYPYYPDNGFELIEYYWVDIGLTGGYGVVLEAAMSDPTGNGFEVYKADADAVVNGVTFEGGGSTSGGTASFTVSDLTIKPASIEVGDKATIGVTVNNVGDADGTCTVNLKINGEVAGTIDVDVAAGESTTVSWATNDQWKAGTYAVDVEGLTGTLVITAGGGGGCLIATATYGSELTPEVQFLRGFRDGTVVKTAAGSGFMTAFNAWYYSFSPMVADAIRASDALRSIMKVVLYPLMGILHAASSTYNALSFSPEAGVLASGIVASALIGAIYFSPVALIGFYALRGRVKAGKFMRLLAVPWAVSLLLIAVGELVSSPTTLMVSSAAFVVLTVAASAAAVASMLPIKSLKA